MSTLKTIFSYQLRDALRSRWLILNGALYLMIAEGLMLAGGDAGRVLLSMINIVLLLVPLVCLVFGTIHYYNSRDFVVLLLTQPVRRRALFMGLYLGLALPLSASFVVGVSLPFLWHGQLTLAVLPDLLTILGLGAFLTLIFVALAHVVATHAKERIQGVGAALLLWMLTAVAYDGLVLLLVNVFSSYPIEKPLLALMMLNPVDLARVILLMIFDAGALMGYTGAVFNSFFGSGLGISLSLAALVLWTIGPLALADRSFARQDF